MSVTAYSPLLKRDHMKLSGVINIFSSLKPSLAGGILIILNYQIMISEMELLEQNYLQTSIFADQPRCLNNTVALHITEELKAGHFNCNNAFIDGIHIMTFVMVVDTIIFDQKPTATYIFRNHNAS